MCKGMRLEGDWDNKDWYPLALIQDRCGWEMNLTVRIEFPIKLSEKMKRTIDRANGSVLNRYGRTEYVPYTIRSTVILKCSVADP
jgi:hypothetical protein